MRRQFIITGITILICLANTFQHAKAQVPARFYWKTLSGVNAIPVLGMFANGNVVPADAGHTVITGADFQSMMIIAGYARTFALFNRAGTIAVLWPMGRLSGEAVIGGTTYKESGSGFGDPMIEFNLNLIGPKAIKNFPDLMRYKPGFSLDIIFDLAFPIGEYNGDQPLNMGQNRWYGRVGTPIIAQLGPWITGKRMTLELLPSVWFFSDNDNYVGMTLSTKPIFQLEAHITRDLIEELWVALDYTLSTGGKATIGGMTGDKISNNALGFTIGYTLSDHIQFTLGYMATLGDSAPSEVQVDGLKISIVAGWHKLIEAINRLEGE